MRIEVKGLLAELREVCAELRPPMLDALGLGAAIRALAEDWTQQQNIPIQLDLPANTFLQSLSEEVIVNLYRVIQEALTNIARHAQAHQVWLSLIWDNPNLRMMVKDDGRGFIPPLAPDELTAQGHFGLRGMQERIELIGGQITLNSAPGEGTEVVVTWTAQDPRP
jgi:signal transduction histidine kinase